MLYMSCSLALYCLSPESFLDSALNIISMDTQQVEASQVSSKVRELATAPKPKLPVDKFNQPIIKVKYPYGVKKNLGQKDGPEVTPAAAAEITQLAIDAGTTRDGNLPPVPPQVAASIYPTQLPDLEWPPKPNPFNPPKPQVEYLAHSKPGVYSMQLPKGLKPVTKRQMEQTAEGMKHMKIRQYYAYNLDTEVAY